MDDKNVKFLEKIESLSEEVQIYFNSEKIGKTILEISLEHGLSVDDVNDVFIDFSISNFDLSVLEKNILTKINNKNILNLFICDFLGKLFLPVEKDIKINISKEIKFRGEKIEKYQLYIDQFNDLIEEKNFDIIGGLAENLDNNFDEKEEEKIVLHFLENDLLSILKEEDVLGARRINGSILYLLVNKKDSLSKFIRAFLANQEILTKSNVVLDEKEQVPTISNWIKHFIKENGSEMFSSISLVKYLTSSVANISLNDDDKKTLRKVLKLYRNLVFFPDSMINVPMESWEIIPIDRDSDFVSKNIKKSKEYDIVEKSSDIKKIDSLDEIEPLKENNNSSKQDIDNKEVQELKKILEKYPLKSLERKAIESEIKKRENN